MKSASPQNKSIAGQMQNKKDRLTVTNTSLVISQVRNNKSVLVLDDDYHFRHLVASMLKSHGYEVQEAQDADEASKALSMCQPGAAIVDFKLPGMNGASWIKQIRDLGCDIPIVFVSDLWCDELSFQWLRGTLNVSLIIQKPVVPELFLHTIESVLPPIERKRQPAVQSEKSETQTSKGRYTEILRKESPVRVLLEIDEMLSSMQLGPNTASELQALKDAVEIELLVSEAKQAYLAELPALWKDLDKSIRHAYGTDSPVFYQEALRKVHKLKGSSGTCGVDEIFLIAQHLENLLIEQQAVSETYSDEWFTSAVLHALTEGANVIAALGKQHLSDDTISHVTVKGPAARTEHQGIKVLVVDDDLILSDFMENILRHQGYSARSLAEPIKILDVLTEFRPHLILLDAVMPGISGYEVCRMLKAHEWFKNIPIIFMTADSCSRREAAKRAGADEFLAKPLISETLLERISALVPRESRI